MAGFISTLKTLFGGSAAPAAKSEKAQQIGDFQVFATPKRDGAQFRLAGRIEFKSGEQILVRHFIRADLFASEDDAVETAFRKAQQIIDQHGAGLFSDGAALRQV
jgi:hypothetical protein